MRFTANRLQFSGLDMPMPCRVFDALGNMIPFCVFIDTDTGEIVRADTDQADAIRIVEGRPILLREFFAAPIRIEPLDDDEAAPHIVMAS